VFCSHEQDPHFSNGATLTWSPSLRCPAFTQSVCGPGSQRAGIDRFTAAGKLSTSALPSVAPPAQTQPHEGSMPFKS
jgi:hypothetical protein